MLHKSRHSGSFSTFCWICCTPITFTRGKYIAYADVINKINKSLLPKAKINRNANILMVAQIN